MGARDATGQRPGNRYGVPYLWGTTGFTYNVKMIRERMPDAPVDSGDMIFKPEVARTRRLRHHVLDSRTTSYHGDAAPRA